MVAEGVVVLQKFPSKQCMLIKNSLDQNLLGTHDFAQQVYKYPQVLHKPLNMDIKSIIKINIPDLALSQKYRSVFLLTLRKKL